MFDADDPAHLIDAIAGVVGGKSIVEYVDKYGMEIANELRQRIDWIEGVPFQNTIPYSRVSWSDPEALDLVQRMLVLDHKEE